MSEKTVRTYPIDDHMLLTRVNSQQLHILDALASRVWQQLAENQSLTDIAQEITNTYDVSLETARRDIARLVWSWRREGLIGKRHRKIPPESGLDLPVEGHRQNLIAVGDESIPKLSMEKYYTIADCVIRVGYGSARLADQFTPLIGRLVVEKTASVPQYTIDVWYTDEGYCLSVDGDSACQYETVSELVNQTIASIMNIAAKHELRLIILHAGAVSIHSRGLILAGSGGKGKSTLTTALALHGFDYLGDDVIPIEAGSGRILPLPVSPCLKQGSWEIIANSLPQLVETMPIDRFGQAVKYPPLPKSCMENGTEPVSSSVLVFPRWDNSSPTKLQRLTDVAAIQKLVESGCAFGMKDNACDMQAVIEWLAEMELYSLDYSDLNEAIAVIDKLRR